MPDLLELQPEEVLMECEERMELAIVALHKEFTTVRSGRANPKMFERVTVDYYSVETPINQVAAITSPEGNQIYVKPYDKSLVNKIEKAILAGNFGITPVNDGMGVRLVFPALTEERRREAVKSIRRIAEEIKNGIRSIRRDAIEKVKKLEKEAHLPEDDSKYWQDEVQKLTDKFNLKIEQVTDDKEREIMHI
ncbi:MAG TPA: ribosome recycling factor [Acholeplasmatales bacterium]|nr:ribosome recycling factor [Acholeplasmatales bacterium]